MTRDAMKIEATTTEVTTIETKRFGPLEVGANRIITMEKPILGFENQRRFVIVQREEVDPFAWFQAVDDPELAFLIINPTLFFPDYSIEIHSREVEDIGVKDASDLEVYVIVTAAREVKEMTANLQGPIIVNTENQMAKQLIMGHSGHSVAESLFVEQGASAGTPNMQAAGV